jgi:hypothetical protein
MLGASFLLLAICIYLYQVPAAPAATTAMPRYDIIRELRKTDGKVLTGFRVEGGNKFSNEGRIVSRNFFKAHELLVRLRESTTTYPELVSQGEKMDGLIHITGHRFVAITYLDGIHEKSILIPTHSGEEELLFGPTCGALIKDLWSQVSDPQD